MGLAQRMIRRDQPVPAHQPVNQGLHRQSTAPNLRVGDYDPGLHDVAGGDFERDTGRDRLQVHLRLGEVDRLQAGSF